MRVWRGTFLLEKIEVHASSKYIKFRVESCKSQSHLNSIRFTLCSLCLGWYPAKSRLLWNYGMNINHIEIMFAVFSRDAQSAFVYCIQLSRNIVSDTCVVTCPFMYIIFISVARDILFLKRSNCKLYSVFSTCFNLQCSNWLIWLYLVLIKIRVSGDT